ncbi:MAG: glycosyltransferase 87 family protein [Nitrospirota bacterium]
MSRRLRFFTPNARPNAPSADGGLAALGVGIALVCIVLVQAGDLRAKVAHFLWLYGTMFALYLVAIAWISRSGDTPRLRLPLIVLIGVLCRAILLAGEPTLSDDIYRYQWDGRVQLAGTNPYRYPPNHPDLAFLRTPADANINHPDLETIYPPGAQWVFRAAAALSPDVSGQKAAFVLFDIATIGVIAALLRQRSHHPAWCLIYAWNPLVLIEYAHSGHVDSIAVFWLVLGLYSLGSGRPGWGMASLALAALAKYFAAILLPYAIVRSSLRRWIPLFVAVIVLGYAWFVDAPRAWFASLGVYAARWEFNSASFTALNLLLGHGVWTRAVLLAALLAWSLYHARRQQDPVRYAYLVIGFALTFSPTLHPWYVCWIVPFLCVYRSPAWIAFTGLVALSYWVWVDARAGGAWTIRPQLLALEYAPFYALLAWEGCTRVFPRRRGRASATEGVTVTSSS